MSHSILTLLAGAAQDYQPYTPGAGGEAQVSAPLYVVLAYSLIWLVLLLFVVSVFRRQRTVEQELSDLKQDLES